MIVTQAPFSYGTGLIGTEGKAANTKIRDAKFEGSVNLRAFTYDQIRLNWKNVFSRLVAYDRQPYVQLEQFFRASGDDRSGGMVYIARRNHERRHNWRNKQKITASFQWIQWTLYNYGARPYRLMTYSAIVILLGMLMFSSPNAVLYKDEKMRGTPIKLNYTQAFGMSLRVFIPIVEVPSGGNWIPSEAPAPVIKHIKMSFAGYATFHRLAGAILMPLGIAALAGILHRKGKA